MIIKLNTRDRKVVEKLLEENSISYTEVVDPASEFLEDVIDDFIYERLDVDYDLPDDVRESFIDDLRNWCRNYSFQEAVDYVADQYEELVRIYDLQK